jgi:hypothetical protein
MAEKSFKVVGAAVVLPLETGRSGTCTATPSCPSEGFTKEAIEHAVKVGLIESTTDATSCRRRRGREALRVVEHDRIDAWAAYSSRIELVNPTRRSRS